MLINLKSLQQALAPIAKIGHGEISCDVDGTHFELRTLITDEMAFVQSTARQVLVEDSDYPAFRELFKRLTLAHSIIQVNELDLRDEKYLETESPTDSDKMVRVEKHVALRKLIETWAGETITYLFGKYSELQTRCDIEAEQKIKYIPADLTSEIERLENRVKELKTVLEAQTPTPPAGAAVDIVARTSTAEEHAKLVSENTNGRVVQPMTGAQRQRILPTIPAPKPEIQDSFMGGSEAIEQEAQRLEQERASRVMPHVQARQVPVAPVAVPLPQYHGTDPEPLSENDIRSQQSPALTLRGKGPSGPVVVNQAPTGTANPRFRGR